MQWQKLTAKSKPKAPCVLAWVWGNDDIGHWRLLPKQELLDQVLKAKLKHIFYNRFVELPEVK